MFFRPRFTSKVIILEIWFRGLRIHPIVRQLSIGNSFPDPQCERWWWRWCGKSLQTRWGSFVSSLFSSFVRSFLLLPFMLSRTFFSFVIFFLRFFFRFFVCFFFGSFICFLLSLSLVTFFVRFFVRFFFCSFVPMFASSLPFQIRLVCYPHFNCFYLNNDIHC